MNRVVACRGVARLLWRHNNLVWTEVNWSGTSQIAYPMPPPATKVVKTVYIKFKDVAGNLSSAYPDSIAVTP